jgi:hypothetical protein
VSEYIVKALYDTRDIGCYADCAFGHAHIRGVLREQLAHATRAGFTIPDCAELERALDGEMSDDAWEEDAALDALNALCFDCYFILHDGDLLLVPEGWEP